MNLNSVPGLTVKKFRGSVFWAGLSWGLLQLAVLLVTFGPAYPAAQIGVLLILGIAFLSGYVVVTTEKILRALPISQFIGYAGLFLSIVTVPSMFSARFPGDLNNGEFFGIYFAGLAILTFIISILGTILGAAIGDRLKTHPKPRLIINDYRLFFVGFMVVILVAGSGIFATALIAQNNDLSRENAFLQQNSNSLSYRVAHPTYNYSLYLAAQMTKNWTSGTENISLWATLYGVNSGYIQVTWNSTVTVSFHIHILDVTISTPSAIFGSFRIPIVESPPVDEISWFHSDGCPSLCPAGAVTYTIIYWF
jgi:hypothetical protein